VTSGRHDGGSPVGGRASARRGERPAHDPGRELDALLTNWGSERDGQAPPTVIPPSRPQRRTQRADGWSTGPPPGSVSRSATAHGDDSRGAAGYGQPADADLGGPARHTGRPAHGPGEVEIPPPYRPSHREGGRHGAAEGAGSGRRHRYRDDDDDATGYGGNPVGPPAGRNGYPGGDAVRDGGSGGAGRRGDRGSRAYDGPDGAGRHGRGPAEYDGANGFPSAPGGGHRGRGAAPYYGPGDANGVRGGPGGRDGHERGGYDEAPGGRDVPGPGGYAAAGGTSAFPGGPGAPGRANGFPGTPGGLGASGGPGIPGGLGGPSRPGGPAGLGGAGRDGHGSRAYDGDAYDGGANGYPGGAGRDGYAAGRDAPGRDATGYGPQAYGNAGGYTGAAAYAGGLDAGEVDPGLLTHRAAYDPDGDPLDDRYGYPEPPDGGGYDPDGDSFYPDDPDDRRDRAARHRRPGRPGWLKVMAWVAAVLCLFGVAIGGWGFFEYRRLSNNITRIDALAPNDPSIKQAARQRDAENYLLIGSDTREGANSKFGNVTGARSDTTILAHLSPNRDKALLISFPRDSYVDIPSCQKTGGGTSVATQDLFNSAFTIGGPKCTVLTVQKMTGIAINHYVQVDFTGFQTMVDALGGVTICSTEDVYDKNSGLRLHKGNQLLRGAQALAFVRARESLGDGSDIGRIQRQQKFLGAMVRRATSSRLLFNPLALTRFLDAATKSLTLDRGTSLKDLKGLSDQLRDLDPKKVSFITAPIANQDYSPPGTRYRGKVLLDDIAGRRLWDSIINDKPAPPKGSTPATTKPKTATKITLTAAPGDVTVKVLNGVGVSGLAARTAADLTSVGFAIANTGNGPTGTKATQIRYAPSRLAAAQTLAAAVPGSVLQEDNSLGRTVQLVVGTNYHGATAVSVGESVTPPPTGAATATTTSPSTTTTAPPVPAITAGDTSCT
jgi:LCP family protein required for cell wall assembly